ncbi:hypothetical protein [Streptomyces sp. NPDC047130]|uniref:hypothetical protein n=1 Tax=Streptomyces sp. NPDC047130 TaxID=3155261 RepID=UPI0033C818E9
MTSPEILATRALTQAAMKMAQAASSPTVMVKHGRREDRAAAYDRFVQACATFYQGRGTSGVNDLYATCHSVELRAPRRVREAAATLCQRIVGTWLDPHTLTAWPDIPIHDDHPAIAEHRISDVHLVSQESIKPPPPGDPTNVIADPDELRDEIGKFLDLARDDINNRWWHWPVATRNGNRDWWNWALKQVPFLQRWWVSR